MMRHASQNKTGKDDGRIRLLYVEDNPIDVDLTKKHFARTAPEFVLHTVETGEACLRQLREANHDLVLLDHRLPDMEGLDVLRGMREMDLDHPVVIVTGVGDEDLVIQALRLGASQYVSKGKGYLNKLPDLLRSVWGEQRNRRSRQWPARPIRLLYIEHSEPDIDLTVRYFSDKAPHLIPEICKSSQEAIVRLQSGKTYEMALIDLRMPEMNALDFLSELKTLDLALPCIVVTGQGDENAAVSALRLGAYDYIVKRENYLVQLPYAIENVVGRFELNSQNALLCRELAEANASLEKTVQARTASLEDTVNNLKQAEEKLRTAKDGLEDEVASRTRELSEANHKLKDLDRLKTAFLSTMSHELRTPLNSIIGLTGILQQGLVGPLNAEQEKQMGMIRSSGRHLLDLINDILDISSIEAGQFKVQHDLFNLSQLIVKVVETMKPAAQIKGLILVTKMSSEMARVTSDRRRVEQVLMNLLSNAIKFSEKGEVRVEVFVEDRFIRTRVIDGGIGIKPEGLTQLFKPFSQVESPLSRPHLGTGLGLAISKKIVEKLGGEIGVESVWGQGSAFYFTLPRGEGRP